MITAQDLQQALARQKLTLQPGDAVIIHTGWGKLWGKDNARYQQSSPGIGVAAAEWLARQDPMLVGADNSAIEVSPNPNPQLAGPVHQIMLVIMASIFSRTSSWTSLPPGRCMNLPWSWNH